MIYKLVEDGEILSNGKTQEDAIRKFAELRQASGNYDDDTTIEYIVDEINTDIDRGYLQIVEKSESDFVAKREYDTINPKSEMPHGGFWVVRDTDGNWIDADQYRNDLKVRYPGIKILED